MTCSDSLAAEWCGLPARAGPRFPCHGLLLLELTCAAMLTSLIPLGLSWWWGEERGKGPCPPPRPAASFAEGRQRCVTRDVFYIRAGCVPTTGPGAAAGWVREPWGLYTSGERAPRWGEDKNKERSHLPL